jgi:uncharacterized RDD family membrane protein YckC
VTTVAAASAPNEDLRGRHAGIVTRFEAFIVDVLLIGVIFAIGGRVAEYVLSVILSRHVDLSTTLGSDIALGVWAFVYSAYTLGASNHTPGMALFGIRTLRTNGDDLGAWHAILRVLVFPISFALFCVGFLLIVLRRDRRALHDLIANTSVIYAWDARPAHMSFLTRR